MTPSVRLVSFRGDRPRAFQALAIECEDVVAGLADVELVDAGRVASCSRWRARLDQRAPWLSDLTAVGKARSTLPMVDLLLVHTVVLESLMRTVPLRRLLRRAGKSACWVHELFVKNLMQRTGELRWLRQFDALFVGMEDTAAHLAAATGRPTFYLPHPVDCLAWTPPEPPPPRVIDVYWYGRRIDSTHQALVRLAEQHGLFYVFDTASPGSPQSIHVHRRALIDLCRRTRIMFVNPAKANVPEQTGDQLEIGYRYIEAAAAGAVMVGGKPTTAAWDRLFGWPGALAEVPLGATEVADVILPLLADEGQRHGISRRAVAEALRQYDIAYRWKEILQHFGMPLSEALQRRLDALHARAAAFDPAPVA